MWSNKSSLLLDHASLQNLNLSGGRVLGTSEEFTLISPPRS